MMQKAKIQLKKENPKETAPHQKVVKADRTREKTKLMASKIMKAHKKLTRAKQRPAKQRVTDKTSMRKMIILKLAGP